jgi:hypothetical protein
VNVRNSPLLVDVLIAGAIAGLVLLLTAGLAIAGLIGLLVLIACAISAAREVRAARRLRHGSVPRRRASR